MLYILILSLVAHCLMHWKAGRALNRYAVSQRFLEKNLEYAMKHLNDYRYENAKLREELEKRPPMPDPVPKHLEF